MTVIDDLGEYLGNVAHTVVDALFYPVMVFFSMVYGWIDIIIGSFVDLFTSLFSLITVFYDFFVQILSFLPGTWGTIYLTVFMITFVLRLHFFIKGVQIMGFSV
jgi:hypothetical protein